MDKAKKAEIMKKIPKPWGQKEHDQFMKESGMTEEEHEAYHAEHGSDASVGAPTSEDRRSGWHGKNKDKKE